MTSAPASTCTNRIMTIARSACPTAVGCQARPLLHDAGIQAEGQGVCMLSCSSHIQLCSALDAQMLMRVQMYAVQTAGRAPSAARYLGSP